MGNKILQRRQILWGGALATLDVLVSSCAPKIKVTLIPSLSKITFEDALADTDNSKGLRQKYLEQLLAKSPYSKYAHDVVYDHEGTITRKAALEDIEKVISTTEMAQYNAKYLVKYHYKFSKLSEEEKEKKKTYLLSSDGENEFRESLSEYVSGTVNAPAWCRGLVSEIGNKIKPKIYISGEVFEKLEMGVLRTQKQFKPSEEILQAIIEHELMHSYDYYNGIDLANGLRIDSSNSLSIDPKLLNFVLETRAYLHAHEFAKARLGEQAKQFALFLLYTGEYYNGAHTVNEDSLTPFQKEIFQNQKIKVEKTFPEIEKMLRN